MALPLATTVACSRPAAASRQGRAWISSTGATTGRKPRSTRRAAVSLAPGSGRVIRTPVPASGPVPGSGKDVPRAIGAQAGAQFAADPFGVAHRAVQAALEQERAVAARHQP